jgi:shikimate kinase
MNIVLIGFMGVGKTAVGQKLAQQLDLSYLDTDDLIEKTEGSSINEIFVKKGEPYFRQLETEVLKTLQDYDKFVISTGGGIVLREENVRILKEIGPLILLWAEPMVVYERVKAESHRPLLTVPDPQEEIHKILAVRKPLYQRAADFTVDTSSLKVEEAVKEIMQWLKSRSN